MIALDAWDKTVDQLSEEEKQTVSALATLASGLAGGLVGNSGASVVAGAQAGKTVVENNHLSTGEKLVLSDKEKKYSASCSGENSGSSACQELKQDIDKLKEKGRSIDKVEENELGPDFQLPGTEQFKNNPGDIVPCVNSSNGYCVVTDQPASNGREWMLADADEVQAIAAKHQDGKAEDFIRELGAAYYEAGCGMPGVASALCQTYSAVGGANPISGKVPTDAERVTWAIAAATNTVGNIAALKAGTGKGVVQVNGLGNVDDFLASQSKNLNKKLGAKIGEGRLPYEAGKIGVEHAKTTIKETLENVTQVSSKIPSSTVRGEYDLIHVYISKTNSTVSLRVLPGGKYEFDTLIPEKSSKF